jgi:hypothetical protein
MQIDEMRGISLAHDGNKSPPGQSQKSCCVTVKRVRCESYEDLRRARIAKDRMELARSSVLSYGIVFDGD